MSARERVYRPAALGRLDAPDELEELPRLARPHRWLAAAAALLAGLAAAAWSLAG